MKNWKRLLHIRAPCQRLHTPVSWHFLTSKYHWHFFFSYNIYLFIYTISHFAAAANVKFSIWRSDEAVLLQAAGWAGQQQTAAELHRKIQQGGDTARQGGGIERQNTHSRDNTERYGHDTSVSSAETPRGLRFHVFLETGEQWTQRTGRFVLVAVIAHSARLAN